MKRYFIIEAYQYGEWDAAHVGFNRALWATEELAEKAANLLVRKHGYIADNIRIMHIDRLDDGETLQ